MTSPFAMLTVVLILLAVVLAGHVMALQTTGGATAIVAVEAPAPLPR